jgi:hypothetical protein|nr:MAG TPA: hypothetical protein [Caudoviricetes sp.]
MLTIYTGHHLEKVTPNVNLEPSSLDAPETTIRKATTIFEQAKATSIIVRTNDILFLDAIRTVAMENDMLDAVTIIHIHDDHTSHQLKFDENGNLNSPCHYSSAHVEINNRFYKILYEKRRKNN